MRTKALVALAAPLLWTAPLRAEAPRFYNVEGFGEFLDGNPETTAVSEDGAITLPPGVRERFVDAAASYSAATAWGEDVVVARTADGEVLAIDRAGKSRTLYKAEEKLVTALLATDRGLFVAVAAPARIIKVTDNGKASTFHTPDAAYIWGMVEGPANSLLCVTGEPGTVLKVDSSGNGHVLFSPEQEHMRSIARDATLGLFVGGGSRGIVYRSADLKSFRALYDTGHPEVTALAVRNNFVYAAGVTGAEALVAEPSKDKRGKGKGSEVRSQLVQIAMDGSTETLAGSSDEAVFALGLDDKGRVLVATGATGREDPRGRLYTVEPERRLIAMIYQSPSRRITHLVGLPRGATAAVAAEGGRVVHLAGGIAAKGEFLTLPFDTSINSQYGVIQIFGSWPKSTRVSAAVRSGQTAEPDQSWSEWSKEVAAPGGSRPQVPNGRYVQMRLTLTASGSETPLVHRVRLAYLRQNLPPFVREVVALKKGVALFALPVDEPKSKTVSLADKAGEEMQRGDGEERGRKRPPQARQVEQRGALTLKWLADDPNGDDLRYALQFRALGEGNWQNLGDKLDQPFYTLNSAQLPDGHYQFRVRATDAPSNPDGTELSDSRESRAVLIDNSAPRVDQPKVKVEGRKVTVRTVVADSVGPVTTAEYALDAQDFRPLLPDDGVLDGAGETFTVRLAEVEPGAHVITIRVTDEAENEGFGEAQFVIR